MLARALPVLPIVRGQDAPTLTDRLRAYHYAKLSSKATTAFITPDARSSSRKFYKRDNPVCDRVLRIQDPGTLILALGWRCTTIGFRYTCRCSHMFGRSHVSNCHLLDNFSLDLGPVNVLFECDKAKYAFPSGSEYSLLDCLLNHGKFYLFEQCLTHILSSLGTRHPMADNNSGSSRASSPEPEPEAHEQVPVLRRPASQQMTAPQSQRLCMLQRTLSPNLRVQQRSSDNETSLPSSSQRRINNPKHG
ncbi:hypothetical protein DSO57_1037243 [Entomophthora muscae]|uniref:Uncharacterized protein n=1 Tax=Entomophthora muscae TaxID=34485 RepID=A0ACC2SBY8_9FUNG|nr:hypothetical protein DSO57_1037243 [Entomophthora muscae]